ncbi:hypothetical protein [Duganella sp. Root1480D1]|uniref:hypothetical protein n=1 Tax=Duganella sp. Root1480D1 TaxID=1736471 RepID=UPI000AB3D031|nr:hypothetical protein [Duganella sp. Root1480D1]
MPTERTNGRRASDWQMEARQAWRAEVVELSATARLKFAKQLLCGLGLFSVGVMLAYGMFSQNKALEAMFEFVKIGMLPIVTLTASYYFPIHR